MIKRLSILDLHVELKRIVEKYSDLKVIDNMQTNEPSPFIYLEVLEKKPEDTKTMFIDRFLVHLHIISKPDGSSINHYENIQKTEEALTMKMQLQEPFEIFRQTNDGLVSNKMDETNERHAVLAYSFWVSYGFKIKI